MLVTRMAGAVLVMSGVVLPGVSRSPGALDGDGAGLGACPYRDGLLGVGGRAVVVELVADVPALRRQVEPGGNAGPDADVDLAKAALDLDVAAGHLEEPDAAVRGLRRDR